jgi:hypothetical protein
VRSAAGAHGCFERRAALQVRALAGRERVFGLLEQFIDVCERPRHRFTIEALIGAHERVDAPEMMRKPPKAARPGPRSKRSGLRLHAMWPRARAAVQRREQLFPARKVTFDVGDECCPHAVATEIALAAHYRALLNCARTLALAQKAPDLRDAPASFGRSSKRDVLLATPQQSC